jgi:hypothetical protein
VAHQQARKVYRAIRSDASGDAEYYFLAVQFIPFVARDLF